MFCTHCGNQLKPNSKFCSSCGKSTEHQSTEHKISHENSTHHEKLPEYYAPSTLKLIILGVLSLGIYDVYWMAKMWGIVNKVTESKSKDTWGKAIFSIFYAYSLFKQVKQIAQKADIKVGYSPGWLAAGFIILLLITRAENEVALIGLLSVLCVIPVNNAMKSFLHKKYGKHEWSFLSKGEFFSIIVGLLIMAFWFAVAWNEESAIITDTTTNSYATQAGYQFPTETRNAFTKSCMDNEGTTEGCNCLLGYFETNYSLNDYAKLEEEYAKTNVLPDAVNKANTYCFPQE
jgi:hypothetical protein